MTLASTLGWDIAVLVGYFTLILWIGLKLGKRDETLGEFALAGRKMPWWAVLGSIIAAETSAGTFIGTPGEGYALRNYTYLQLAFGTILARIIIGFTFIRPYYEHKVYSVYEFLEYRFGRATKNAASATFLVTRVLASGTRLYVGAIILVIGYRILTQDASAPLALSNAAHEFWIYCIAIAVMTALTALYTSFGGIKAVIWTDLIQATIMVGSALTAIYILCSRTPGGFGGAVQSAGGWASLKLWDSGWNGTQGFWANIKAVLESEYTIGAALLGSTFTTMATHGTDQDMVQRLLTAPDARKSRLSLVLSGLADIPVVLVFLTIGILLWSFYKANPDPALPAKTNEIFAYFILKELPVGVRGLLVAGIFATAMGSLSAALNALATSFTRDWYQPIFKPGATQEQQLRAARVSTYVFSILMVLVAAGTAGLVIAAPKSRVIPIALGVFGYTYGSLLGVFLVGMLTKNRGSDRGNLIGMAAGFVAVAILSGLPNEVAGLVGLPSLYAQPDWLPIIEFPWRVMAGSLVTFGVAVAFPSPSRAAVTEAPSAYAEA